MSLDTPPTSIPLGSFVYAMPDRLSPTSALSTPLVEDQGSIDFGTRVAKILARKLERPVYVGCSVKLEAWNVEEEVEGVKGVVERVVGVVRKEG